MKSLSTVLFIMCLSFHSMYGQCEVEAGANGNICPEDLQTTAQLHGEVVSGDMVKFEWTSTVYEPYLDRYYFASDFLSDTTVLEPVIMDYYGKTIKFFLTGTTSSNEICTDSVELNFSSWTTTLLQKITGKAPSDTVELWVASESCWPHVQYEWSPNYMISDTTVRNPLVWNDTTVFYNLVITDTLGCSITDPLFSVYVNPTATSKINDEQLLSVFPNPTTGILNIKTDHLLEDCQLFDLNGKLIRTIRESHLDMSEENEGTYILRINLGDEKFTYRKVIKVKQ